MKLTGNAKEKFEEWFKFKWREKGSAPIGLAKFYSLPESMKWGIYQDWADSMGYEMWVEKAMAEFRYWYNIYEKDGRLHYNEGFQTRQEARNSVIDKLNEIINEKKCKYVKREGESCTLNDNCTYPNCKE